MAFRSAIFMLTLLLSCASAEAKQNHSSEISLGTSIFPTVQPTSWPSSSGLFEFGFYAQGSGFFVGIWLVGNSSKRVVWTASRDDVPYTSSSTLELTTDGKLVLRTEQDEKLIANAMDSAASASMLDSGNFVLYNEYSEVIWESFDSPTDTILGGQNLSAGSELLSSLSETNHSTGRFRLKMQHDGNLVLYPLIRGNTPGDAYWSSDTYKENLGPEVRAVKFNLCLNNTGSLAIVNSTDLDIIAGLYEQSVSTSSSSSNNNNNTNTIVYRATLDVDGVFRLYSHTFEGIVESNMSIEWESLKNPCEVKSFCGFNSFCTFNDNQPVCMCLPGTDFINHSQWNLGCERNFSEQACRFGKEDTAFYSITTMERITWGDRPYLVEKISTDDCKKSCLEDCNCGAALYVDRSCQKQGLPLRYVRRQSQNVSESIQSTAFLKVGTRSIQSENWTTPTFVKPPAPPTVVVTSRTAVMLIFLLTTGLSTCSCAALAISGLLVYKFRVLRYQRLLEYGNLSLINEDLTLRLFSYNELRKATNGFKEELGKGSFGAVYKGTLNKGKNIVAVKRLEKLVEEGEVEFRAEMRAIGRTHHRNLVRLLGYCAEDSKRLLVYKYMSNGSLADLLFRAERRRPPHWDERVRIALEVARGILYLHEECDAPIIHCDIKPQNILMDDFWTAKISDFGLAKLLMPDQTRTFTVVRGTRGYMAPEWHRNTPISVKADVYSYGIVLFEILCCRRNLEVNVSEPDQIVLANWGYKCFVGRELKKLVGAAEEVDKRTLENMVKVGLWCIQDEPALRPTMKSVVLMLQGITEIPIPPCPSTTLM